MAVIRTQFTLRPHTVNHAKIKKIAASESRTMTNMIEFLIKKEILSSHSFYSFNILFQLPLQQFFIYQF